MCRSGTLGVAATALEDQIYAAQVGMIGSCLDIDGSKVQGREHGSLTETRCASACEKRTGKQASDALGIKMERIGAPYAMRAGSLQQVSCQNWRD